MKSIFFFLLGAVVGAYGMYVYIGREGDAGASVTERLSEWRLTPGDVRADLEATGQVVRARARAAGETINDLRIVATIKAKFVLDRELSAADIRVFPQLSSRVRTRRIEMRLAAGARVR